MKIKNPGKPVRVSRRVVAGSTAPVAAGKASRTIAGGTAAPVAAGKDAVYAAARRPSPIRFVAGEPAAGRSSPIRFVAGEPAALIGTTLVVADLHIGIEHEFWRRGVKMPSGTALLKRRLLELVKKTRARELVVLGDVKHKVPGVSMQEERELPLFFAGFPVPVTVTPGNHDPELARLAPEVNVAPSAGFTKGPLYFSHGHAWPAKASLACDTVVIGHVHPSIEFRDAVGKVWVEPVWVKAELDRKEMGKKYGALPAVLPHLIVVPAFNQLTGSVPLNRAESGWLEQEGKARESGPLVKCATFAEAEVTLLDGTYLGTVESLKKTTIEK